MKLVVVFGSKAARHSHARIMVSVAGTMETLDRFWNMNWKVPYEPYVNIREAKEAI